MNRLILHLKVVLGIVLTLNIGVAQAVIIVNPPPAGQDCYGQPIGGEEYALLMQVMEGIADIYSYVFEQPFNGCYEPPLLLDWHPTTGEQVRGVRLLPDGGAESFVFSVVRLTALTIEDYQQAVSVDPETVAQWQAQNISFGPVRGFLTGPVGSVEILGVLSGGLDGQGIMRAMLIPELLAPDAPPADPMIVRSPFYGHMEDPRIQEEDPPPDPCTEYNTCLNDANNQFSSAVGAADALFACCLTAGVAGALGSFWGCAGLFGWSIGVGLAACLAYLAVATAVVTVSCTSAHDGSVKDAEEARDRALDRCTSWLPPGGC